MKFEVVGIDYHDLKEHLDNLVMNHNLITYKLKKVYGLIPGYWLLLVVNKRTWLKTWRDTGNAIKDTNDCIERSFVEELQGMGFDDAKVRLIE